MLGKHPQVLELFIEDPEISTSGALEATPVKYMLEKIQV